MTAIVPYGGLFPLFPLSKAENGAIDPRRLYKYVPLVVTGLLPKVTSISLHIGLMAPVWLPVASVLFGLTS